MEIRLSGCNLLPGSNVQEVLHVAASCLRCCRCLIRSLHLPACFRSSADDADQPHAGPGVSTFRTTWQCSKGPKDREKVPALQANRRSFDCASRDETARGSAQDYDFYIINHLSPGYMSIHPSIPPLRCAPVGMTDYADDFGYRTLSGGMLVATRRWSQRSPHLSLERRTLKRPLGRLRRRWTLDLER
jgi:hypothetical protein